MLFAGYHAQKRAIVLAPFMSPLPDATLPARGTIQLLDSSMTVVHKFVTALLVCSGILACIHCSKKPSHHTPDRNAPWQWKGLMPSEEIPDDLRDFIVNQIGSIAQLEALLLLKNNAQHSWTAADCARRLYVTDAEAAQILSRLAAGGFLVSSDTGYRFGCRSPAEEEIAERLSTLYREKLIPVTNLIHSRLNRIRQFANAFRLRKDS